jgi:RNA polymerase sigma-70 factor (ECF subfamily)
VVDPATNDQTMTLGPPTLRAIYDEHVAFVWRALRRLGVRESDLPDAVQDVFLVVHRKLPEFEGRSKVSTWLFGIAMRVARDRSKLAHVRRQVGDEEAVLAFVDENADVAAQAERRQAAEMLEAILDGLPLEQRAVFTLFELDGMSGDAIAELLEIPLGTVYSRLRLAREAFQRSVSRLKARQDRPPTPRSSAVRARITDEPSDEGVVSPRRAIVGGAL